MTLKLQLILLIYLFSNTLAAQSATALADKVFELQELSKPPSFPGGAQEMFKYIYKNLQLPDSLTQQNLTGTKIVLSFIVGIQGNILDIKILKNIWDGSGNEAIRMVASMPIWTPGEFLGKPVNARYILPIQLEIH